MLFIEVSFSMTYINKTDVFSFSKFMMCAQTARMYSIGHSKLLGNIFSFILLHV